MDNNKENEFGLVMPFLPVASKGGPHDDVAYVAGYEMGRMDVTLATAHALGLTPDAKYYITSANQQQMDLIAMRHGFLCEFDQQTDEWVSVTVTPITPDEEDGDE